MKKCSRCKKILPKSQFYKSKTTKLGIRSYCKKCHKIEMRKARTERPPKEYQYNNEKVWTEEDMEYLAEYHYLDAIELGYALGRSAGSIYTKKLDLKKKGMIK